MSNVKLGSRVVGVALLCLASVGGCSKSNPPAQTADHASRAEQASGQLMSSRESLRATVVAVDPTTRVVSLKDDEGHRFMVEAGEGVAIEKLSPNDEVTVTYQEAVSFALQDPASEHKPQNDGLVEEQTRRQSEGGVQLGRQISTTVQIVSVAQEGKSATFRVPNGGVRTVEIPDQKTQSKVAMLRPGDSVDVTYTEKLALAIDSPSGS